MKRVTIYIKPVTICIKPVTLYIKPVTRLKKAVTVHQAIDTVQVRGGGSLIWASVFSEGANHPEF